MTHFEPAPFDNAVADGPQNVKACWGRATDGIRLRLAHWHDDGNQGTILLFPGRTEYLEKYGRTAAAFNALGLSVAAVDWRGQGLADRLMDDPMPGHVDQIDDYRLDVDLLLAFARQENLPEPFFLIGHSMGGYIGLDALYQGLPVAAAMFSSPMWGIGMAAHMRPVAWALSWAARLTGSGHRYTPGTSPGTYVLKTPFEENSLTRDAEMYDYFKRQMEAHPQMALGGPSLHWLNEALRGTRRQRALPAPDFPVLTFLGSEEKIVDTGPIYARMRDWPGGRFEVLDGAEHEVMMEVPAIRDHVVSSTAAFFKSQLAAQ